ncbi:endoglucanase [Microbacterium laevaniformans]|uniref:Endoglucanase n=1 Tax=Microbacterium laevaniformans TaxID=36807 RepID=A0A4S2D6S4_9MICO|nr:cellulase family glycosylhydrolase [Microbacterium laevaniformans]TGY36144.1 endoglucanase [Microbacterium laevaniformans]
MTPPRRPRGFVRAVGTELVDDEGPLLLRGVGLGNWLLAEGYMWLFGDELASPRQIEARIAELVGTARAAEFWRRFRDEFVTERDFALIAQLGFDHVRLPLNARGVIADDGSFQEDGFALIARAVEWAERHGLRVLIDLHGAPGGQTGTNIDDSPRGIPELFMAEHYRAQTVALWREIARRFRDSETVLGYDLLNEPLPNEWQHRYQDELVDLYRELTAAIREIDPNHLLMYEGSHWATNPDPVRVRFDENQAVQFHRYWCAPDETSIADFLQLRRDAGLPIYMGEGGENTPGWIYAATRLYERHGIGWNFWPWKKLDTLTSPLSARAPDSWELIADPTAQLDPDDAWRILREFLAAVAVERCDVRTAVLDALFARPALHLPAWAGVGGEAETSISEQVAAPLPEGLWHHTAGAAYAAAEYVPVEITPGDRLAFAFSSRPASWRVDADRSPAVTADWHEGSLRLSASERVRVRRLEVSM